MDPSTENGLKESILVGTELQETKYGTIQKLFQLQLSENPALRDRKAILQHDESITFGELDGKSDLLARRMAGIVRQDRLEANREGDFIVAVCLVPSVDEIVSLLAILKTGCAYLPIDINFPAHRVIHLLQDSKPLFLLTSRAYMENPEFAQAVRDNARVILIEDLVGSLSSEAGDEDMIIAEAREPLAVVLYTSGSTGLPKGVRLLHRSILHRLHCQWDQFPFEENEICCAKTVRTFVDSIPEIWGPILKGVPLVVVQKSQVQDPQTFVEILKNFKVTRLVLVPSLLNVILDFMENYQKDITLLDHVRIWICSGEVLSPKLVSWFFRIFPSNHVLCNFYGSTEVTCDVTTITFNCARDAKESLYNDKVPLGKPLPGCQIYLLDKDRQCVDVGDVGEIYVAGELLAAGYVNQVEMERFVSIKIGDEVKRMFRTGDFGRIVSDRLMFEGRADSQIKVRGHRVDLEEISLAVQSLPCVQASAVLCYENGGPEQEIVTFVQIGEGITATDIFNYLRGKLMSYMVPKVIAVPSIPLLVNGKIDRQNLLQHYRKLLENQGYNKVANLDKEAVAEIENPSLRPHAMVLLKTIRSILGSSALHQKISFSNNYFQVGGTSLDALTLVLKIRDLGYNLDFADFLKACTLKDVLQKMIKPAVSNQGPFSQQEKYTIEPLRNEVKDAVDCIIGKSFLEKLPIVKASGSTYEDLVAINTAYWDFWIQDGLSFVVKNGNGNIVGVSLNNNGFRKLKEPLNLKGFFYVSDQSDFLDRYGLEKIQSEYENPKIFKAFKLATDISLGAAENVSLMLFMEEENLRIAQSQDFDVIYSVNGNRLTQTITADLLGYEVLMEMPSNLYVAADGTKPFATLPDWDIVTANIKRIKKPNKKET